MKEADLVDVTEVDLAVAMEEEEIIGAVYKMLEWCNTMMYQNLRFIHRIT